ncbi:MAG: PRC-barrel domain-containing protein [Methanobrevibacter sp.]|nr:PRC-barrel domain-containing protein [Methanobrevibacter sp.]
MKFVKELIGKEVLNKDAFVVGKVSDIEFNPDTQLIESLILKKGSISETLNISKGENVIPFDLIRSIGDKIILKDTFENE